MGLMAVKAHGGVTVVQDPGEARFAGMPEHALQFADVDYVLEIRGIAELITRAADRPGMEADAMDSDDGSLRVRIEDDFVLQVEGTRTREQSVYACPECGGVLWHNDEGSSTQFRCYQGHAYAAERLLLEKSETLEDALWSAARALVEGATLDRQLAAKLRERGLSQRVEGLDEQAVRDEEHLRLLRSQILQADRAT